MNEFNNLITQDFKNLYIDAISALVSQNGLGALCKLTYLNNITIQNDCDNCLIDPIYKQSMGKYNGIGPRPFPEGSVCPICNGQGYKTPNAEESLYMLQISDEKSWVKMGINTAKIPEGSLMTICPASFAQKIKNSYSLISNDIEYERLTEINYNGFDDRFLITMWKRIK